MRTGKVLNGVLGAIALSIGAISLTGQAANAASLTPGTTFNTWMECLNDGVGLVTGKNPPVNGWQYAFDSNSDGANGEWGLGAAPGKDNPFEIYGMAIKETPNSIVIALNGNMPLIGNPSISAAGGQVGWGDLFFNLSGTNFSTAMNNGDLFGIRFSEFNASGVSKLGVYGGVQAKTVTDIKNGYTTGQGGLSGYENSIVQLGGTVGYGDLSSNYFAANDPKFNLNAIASGNFLTNISFLARGTVTQQLLATGYNPSKLRGSHTIAFQFDKAALAAKPVPEPSSLAGLALLGLVIAGRKLGNG